MRPSLRRRPQLEALEAMTMLSAAAAVAPVPVAAESMPPASHHIQLSGGIQGTYVVRMVNPDVGKTYYFSGTPGQLSPLGRSKLIGGIQAPGFIANGHSRGALLITNSQGSLTLGVIGPAHPGGPPFPNVFNYTIIRGTGLYQGDTGTGYIALGLTPSPSASAKPTTVQTGHFSMTFLTIPPP